MYQFDFIRTADDDESVISVLAENYSTAVKKLRALSLPNFDFTEWHLEGVYEQGVLALTRNN